MLTAAQMTDEKATAEDKMTTPSISNLNDGLRQASTPKAMGKNRILMTHGVSSRGVPFASAALDAVRRFDDFTPENDPYGEHDFGSVTVGGETLLWKIDYYDPTMTSLSEDPIDPEKTVRVLTIMLAEEY